MSEPVGIADDVPELLGGQAGSECQLGEVLSDEEAVGLSDAC